MNAANDPEVRAAVLASITATEARWLAQNSTEAMRYCMDEFVSMFMSSQPDTVAAWRQTEGIEPPEEQAPWRLAEGEPVKPLGATASSAPMGR